jgi:tetratricopeptide (TPR) repeat protein
MVHAGHAQPARHGRAFRFHFQDLVLLRAAQGLIKADVPVRRVNRALTQLKRQLPAGRPLSGVRIYATGGQIVVRDKAALWRPESGQQMFSFAVDELTRSSSKIVPARRRDGATAPVAKTESARDWFDYGVSLEADDPNGARRAYERALQLDPDCGDAYINLGRLVHEGGDPGGAAEFYRAALARDADDSLTHYNLAVALEDTRDLDKAIDHYRESVRINPHFADAHFNLGRLLEKTGKRNEAIQHLLTYRRLTSQT